MYKIIKNLADQCGNHEYASEDGYYIVKDFNDGRVEISEYNSKNNTWGNDIQVTMDELILGDKVYDTYTWANETYPDLVKETRGKLEAKFNGKNKEAVQRAVDFYLKSFACDIFADKLKENDLGYIEVIGRGEDADCELNEEALEIFNQLNK